MFFAILKGFLEASAHNEKLDDIIAALKDLKALHQDPLNPPPMLLVAPVSHPGERCPPRGTVAQRTTDGLRIVTYGSSEVLAPHPGECSTAVVDDDGYDRRGLIRRYKVPKNP